jgi:uncharacterized protein (TIGR02001 family)
VPAPALSWATQSRRLLLEGAVLPGAVAFWIALSSGNVSAQISGSVALVSDYRYRGVSLSHNNPAAQVAVTLDDASGWYAGAFASSVQLGNPSSRELQAIAFFGYARQAPSGWSWDVGADYSAITGSGGYNYPEVYLGVAFENVSARVYFAPRYFGQDANVIYGELNGAQPLHDRVRLLAHVGILRSNGGNPYYGGSDRLVFDARVGVGIDLDPFHVQVSWVGISAANAAYPITGVKSRNGPVLTLLWSF